MTTRAIIIEDEPVGIVNLKNALAANCPEVEVIATGGSCADLIRITEEYNGRFDVAFLDINLPDGLVFKALSEMDETNFDIIIVTAYNKHYQRAFDFAAIDYILKPFQDEQIVRAVNRIRRRNTDTKQRLEVLQQTYNPNTPNAFEKIGISSVDGVQFVRLREIVRLEGEDNYTHFILKSGERITASRTMKTFEDTLLAMGFLRIHKRHIVNMNYMKTYVKGEGGYVIMENGENIEVSRRRRGDIGDAIRRSYGDA